MNLTDEQRKFIFDIFRDKKIKTTLKYTGSTDGFTYEAFHDKCDKKGTTITLFKMSTGDVVGGFTAA